MAEPWFEPNMFGALFGSVAGGVGGTLVGSLGAAAGYCAPRGIGRTWIMGGMMLAVLAGALCALFGVAALVSGQPFPIWFFPLLCGLVTGVVTGALVPVINLRYREAEGRKMQAEAIRGS